MKYTQETWAYSIIASVMMIWFLLVLTTSTLNLVLQEMNDGKGRQDYLKAFAWAEWWLELALLQVKQKGYWYDEDSFSWQLLWKRRKDAVIWYDFESKVNAYTGSIDAFSTDIIPLFWIDDTGNMYSVSWINLAASSDMSWNIIGSQSGLSWIWGFSTSDTFSSKSVAWFTNTSVSSQIFLVLEQVYIRVHEFENTLKIFKQSLIIQNFSEFWNILYILENSYLKAFLRSKKHKNRTTKQKNKKKLEKAFS